MTEPARRAIPMETPRFETVQKILAVGLSTRFSYSDTQGIPTRWQRFRKRYGEIPERSAAAPFGILIHGVEEDKFDYVCAVEVSMFSSMSPDFKQLRIPARSYAVFSFDGPFAAPGDAYRAILDYPPACNAAFVQGPWFERYQNFINTRSTDERVEIWVPVEFASYSNYR